jgi:hypothetical protein
VHGIKWKTKQNKTPHCPNNSKSNIKIVERGKSDTTNTQIRDRSISWFGTGTSIKSGGIKLVLWVQFFPLSEMMLSCKC